MNIVIPDARTPAGVKCWVRDSDTANWLPAKFCRASGRKFYANASGPWNQCRLDDPVEGWVENTGAAPDVKELIEIKFRHSWPNFICQAAAVRWTPKDTNSDITHWRYPRIKEQPMTPHPQAAILQRIAAGENLKDRLWALSDAGDSWALSAQLNLLHEPTWTFAISDKPGVPPPLPRPMIQLRKDGPKYPQGETVAPGEEAIVWVACFPGKPDVSRWKSWRGLDRDSLLRLGLVHLSEASYRLHVAALEDLLMWAHAGGVK